MESRNTVLITDDEKFIQGMLTRFLKDEYDVLNAYNGKECLNIASQKEPDIILLDVEMPEKNGYQVCETLRANDVTKDIPVIFLSSKSSVEERLLGYAAGGDDYLIKSSTAEELKAKIKRFTSISNHQKDLAKSVDSAHMLNQLLEERVKRRTDKIVEQKDKLESAYQELKMAQKQLVHSEKMASIGQLAAGVAHEINNPVAFVKSNLCSLNNYVETYQKLIHIQQNALEELTEEIDAKNSHLIGELQTFCNDNDIDFINEDIHTLLEEAIDGTSRVEEITKSLKIYSRASDDNMEEFDINCCITDTIKMLNSQLKYSCDVNTTLGQLPMYHGNRSKISQVFTNIIVNAAQAMETKGSLSIHTISDSAAIKIIFADTGKGIAEENLQKLFDPFFTTKPVGEGTGLGLSISHGIIKDHGGDIDVCSEIGKGTTFTILLPIESHTVH